AVRASPSANSSPKRSRVSMPYMGSHCHTRGSCAASHRPSSWAGASGSRRTTRPVSVGGEVNRLSNTIASVDDPPLSTERGRPAGRPLCEDRAEARSLRADRADVDRLGALLPVAGLVLHASALGEALEAAAGDAAVVDEQVL